MAIYFDKTDRLIIPRWREFNRKKLSTDHLPLPLKNFEKPNYESNLFIQQKVAEWQDENTLGNAWELVNAAYIIDDYKIAKDAAKYLKLNIAQIPGHLRKVVSEILGEQVVGDEEIQLWENDIKSLARSIGGKIKYIRQRLSRNIRNEFLWMEMARLYSILGNNIKAENCVIVALQLSTGYNRFILRTASRFFYHTHEYEKAQRIIKSSPFLKADPLLLSAEISYANKQNRTSKFVKLGFELVDSKRYSSNIISELAGMLGTLELKNDSIRSAKKMTIKSLLAPNDNSLAQAEWIARQVNDISVDPNLSDMEYAFEARAFENLYALKFKDALREGIDWVIDQPFSKRAFHFVSYICICFTDNFHLAIEVCEFGLKSNPDTFALINNLAYSYASIGKLDMAKKQLQKLGSIMSNEREHIFYTATQAYLNYKSKDYEKGRLLYIQAITQGKGHKDCKDLSLLAQGYLLREAFIANELPFSTVNKELKDLLTNQKSFDVVAQIEAIINSIEKIQGLRLGKNSA